MKVILNILKFIWHIPRNLAIGVVVFYQTFFSPDHSFWAKWIKPVGHCKFHPSCSEYTRLSLKKHGFIRGSLKGTWRIMRCNPWNDGGVDLP